MDDEKRSTLEREEKRAGGVGGGEVQHPAKGDAEKEGELEGQEEEWTYPEGGRGWRVVGGCFIFAGSTMASSFFFAFVRA